MLSGISITSAITMIRNTIFIHDKTSKMIFPFAYTQTI